MAQTRVERLARVAADDRQVVPTSARKRAEGRAALPRGRSPWTQFLDLVVKTA